MWNKRLKHLLQAAALVGMLAPSWMAGQDQPAAGKQPQYKDQAEFTLYDSILKDTNPKTKLEKLQEWQTKYATTDFEKPRKQLFLDTYVKLNQPKEAVAEAKQILAGDPKDFTSLYYTMYFTRALAGDKPTPEVLDPGEKAATAFLEGCPRAGRSAGPHHAGMDRDATQELGRRGGRIPKNAATGSQ